MGFTVVPLAQKARTKTLIADSDLNLGNYDLIATDVRGDTAEFDEFVGGVGNFSNVLGSGNLDIEGTGNIKGLTTFQNAVQVNGALHVEGSINNVNIADNGEITTAQGVNGADFNGAKITSTKFNGATIDTSGNVTGVKGTFSGAVTGASFNGVTIGDNAFNGVRVVPILSTSIMGHRIYQVGSIAQTVLLLQPSMSVSNGSYTLGRPILSTNCPVNVYDVPKNFTYTIHIVVSSSITATIKLSGSISKTFSFSNKNYADVNMSYNDVVNFIRKNTTLTVSGLSGSTVINNIYLKASNNTTVNAYLVY